MKTIVIAMCILALAIFAGCNKADKGKVVAQPKPSPAKTLDPTPSSGTPESETSGYTALAGTNLSLASGEEVEIISVGKFDTDLQSLGGLIAVEGRVAEVFADKGRMLLVDTDPTKSCQDGCCPLAEVAVRLALENFEGEMPLAETEVIVVGDLTITSMGYEFAVQEIRQDGEVLLGKSEEPQAEAS